MKKTVLKSFPTAHAAVNWVSINRMDGVSIETTSTLKSFGYVRIPSGNYHVIKSPSAVESMKVPSSKPASPEGESIPETVSSGDASVDKPKDDYLSGEFASTLLREMGPLSEHVQGLPSDSPSDEQEVISLVRRAAEHFGIRDPKRIDRLVGLVYGGSRAGRGEKTASIIKSIVEDVLNSELVKLELRKSIDNLALKGYTSKLIEGIKAGDEAARKEGESLTGRTVPDGYSEEAGDAAAEGRHELARKIGVEPAVAPTKETSKFNLRRERVGALQDAISEALYDTKSVMVELKKSIDNLALKARVPEAIGKIQSGQLVPGDRAFGAIEEAASSPEGVAGLAQVKTPSQVSATMGEEAGARRAQRLAGPQEALREAIDKGYEAVEVREFESPFKRDEPRPDL